MDGGDQMPRGSYYGESNTMPADVEGGEKLSLHEEELRATKEQVQKGEVRLGKHVVEEQKTVDVPVTREEVFIERRPVDRQPDDHPVGEDASANIRVPVTEERVDVEKVPVETEEVRIGKREVIDTQHVTDTVKREEARVEPSGDVDVSRAGMGAGTAGRWEDVLPEYRGYWRQHYGNSGRRWEDVESNYRYGWEMSNDPRYSGRSWAQVEPELQQDWQRTHHESAWDRVRDDIKGAWDRATQH